MATIQMAQKHYRKFKPAEQGHERGRQTDLRSKYPDVAQSRQGQEPLGLLMLAYFGVSCCGACALLWYTFFAKKMAFVVVIYEIKQYMKHTFHWMNNFAGKMQGSGLWENRICSCPHRHDLKYCRGQQRTRYYRNQQQKVSQSSQRKRMLTAYFLYGSC